MILHVKKVLDDLSPASRAKGKIVVGTLASGAEIGIPYVAQKGAKPGPCLWINGQVHGNEINGMFAALDFLNGLDPSRLAGSVVVTATANPLALDARRKFAPQDDQDLDQSYPGRGDGFTTELLAHALFAEAKTAANTLINMHTMSPPFEAKPYAVYKVHPNGMVKENDLLRLIAPFRPSVACRMSVEPGKGELPGNIAGALDYQMDAIGIPAFMIELGAGSRATASDIRQGVEGLRGVARELKMIDGENQTSQVRRVTRRGHVTFKNGGLFRASREPGEPVKAGEVLGDLMTVWGDVIDRVSLPSDAIVIGIRRDPVVHSGDRLGFFAYAWDDVTV
jgi:predicted deacylase